MPDYKKHTDIGVVIVAGGSGSRMGGGIPKQFMLLCGRPVLVRTLEAFIRNVPSAKIVVALPENQMEYWKGICREYGVERTHVCCAGGENRFASVSNALSNLPECDMILVHDGVRPLVNSEVIREVVAATQKHGAAVPVVSPVDSFRIVDAAGGSEHFDRDRLRAVQTPQGFRSEILRSAYRQPFDPSFTDDASVVEKSGVKVVLCRGAYENIKITNPADIVIAEAFVKKENGSEI